MEILLSPAFAPFTGILLVLAVLLLIELALIVVAGAGISELSAHVLHLDAMPESSVLDWLFIKETPFLMSLSAFLGGIACTGLSIQGIAVSQFGVALPTALVVACGSFSGVLAVRGLGLGLKRLKFTHSTAIEPHEFIGQTATLLSEDAYKGAAGEAVFVDRHGQPHYVMVEPTDDSVFLKNQQVVLEEPQGTFYYPARAVPLQLN